MSPGWKVQLCDLAVAEFPDRSVAIEGDFVHSARAVDYQAALGAEQTHDIGDLFAQAQGKATPMSWRWAAAGLVRGPRMLKTVRMPISRRTGPAWRMEGWKAWANMKPMPPSLMQRSTPSGGSSMRTPRASSTSAVPQLPGSGAVAVLGDADSGPGRRQRRAGGDVEGVGAVAAGADGIHHRSLDAHLEGELAHDGGHARDFPGGLALEPHGGQEGPELGGSGLALHYLAHDRRCVVHVQGVAGDYCVYCFTYVQGWLLRLWLIERLHSKRVGQTL